MLGGVVENGSGLAQLQEEGALTGQDLVTGANASKNAVNWTEAATFGGNIASLEK